MFGYSISNMELLNTLKSFASDGEVNQKLLNQLIEKTYQLAVANINYHHKKVYRLIQKDIYSVDAIAIDAIAPLFVKDQESHKIPLINAFNNWNPKIDTEDTALFFLTKVTAGRVEQHIFSLLRELDPFFFKILDSVNYLTKTGEFKKICHAGKSFIVEKSIDAIDGKTITKEEFDNIPAPIFIKKKKLLENHINYLKKETAYFPAIPLNELVIRIKHINFADYFVSDSTADLSVKYDLLQFVEIGLEAALEKLHVSYFHKGKLSQFEAEYFEKVLKDMSKDLLDGGINPGMYEYFTVHIKDLKKEFYLNNYHNIIEYLVKVMKTTVAEQIQEKI
ncbi:MAG: hypothetical protein MUO34_06060 [Ignavibacteriaceae bacterium]|nr:hypothetical protein [Ignavibacteriaceae bacterium]